MIALLLSYAVVWRTFSCLFSYLFNIGVAFAKIATRFSSGIDMGQPRLPLHQFSETEIQEIKVLLQENGYTKKKEWIFHYS